MQNQLIDYLNSQREKTSFRKFSKRLGISHTYTTDMLNGKRPMTWTFAARAAKEFGLEPAEAFRLAGLLPSVAEKGSVGATGVIE